MNIVKALCFLLLAGGLFSNGCTHFLGFHGRYEVPELKPSDEIPDPQTEFFRLKTFIGNNDGHITDKVEEMVKWKDTKLFRLYEFEDYTIIIFPYNWSDTLFDLYFIAGHMKSYDNLLNDIYTYHTIGDEYFSGSLRTFNINANVPPERKIGLYGIYLGMPREEIGDFFLEKTKERCLRKKYSEEKTIEVIEYYKCKLYETAKMDLSPIRENRKDINPSEILFECRFLDNKLVWMRIRALRASLSDYGLFKYKLPVIREGEFSTSEEEVNQLSTDAETADEHLPQEQQTDKINE